MWSKGCPAAFDVTVTSLVQGSFVAGTAQVQGHAAALAESRKETKYLYACRELGLSFVLINVEPCGQWGEPRLILFQSSD
jgi:hypothetical protein